MVVKLMVHLAAMVRRGITSGSGNDHGLPAQWLMITLLSRACGWCRPGGHPQEPAWLRLEETKAQSKV